MKLKPQTESLNPKHQKLTTTNKSYNLEISKLETKHYTLKLQPKKWR